MKTGTSARHDRWRPCQLVSLIPFTGKDVCTRETGSSCTPLERQTAQNPSLLRRSTNRRTSRPSPARDDSIPETQASQTTIQGTKPACAPIGSFLSSTSLSQQTHPASASNRHTAPLAAPFNRGTQLREESISAGKKGPSSLGSVFQPRPHSVRSRMQHLPQ